MSRRLALALVLVLVAMLLGGSDGDVAVSRIGVPWGISPVVRNLRLADLAEAAPSAAPTVEAHLHSVPSMQPRVGDCCRNEHIPALIAAFIRGYRAFQGEPAWEARFLNVIACESGWRWRRGQSFHVSVAQFHPDSWATASAATGLTDPEDLYGVGGNTAWWSNEVGPESPGGWSCW